MNMVQLSYKQQYFPKKFGSVSYKDVEIYEPCQNALYQNGEIGVL